MKRVSLCPFPFSTLIWEARAGQFSLTVAVKATFALRPGDGLEVAAEQEALGDDRCWEADPRSSLRAAGDRSPHKARVDVLLVGHAHAPGGVAVETLTARLRVGDLSKAVRVTGDRRWVRGAKGLEPSAPAAFTRLPLRYERAPMTADNPVGVDPHAAAVEGALACANLEALDRAGAAGFGPIASTWLPRRRLLGEAAVDWVHGLGGPRPAAQGPPPAGLDFAFFNSAPRDQQVELLRPGTTVVLENLLASQPRLETRLPERRPQVFRVDPRTGRSEEIALRCDTLAIDADRALVTLTFRGLTDLAGPEEEAVGTLVVVADPAGERLRFEHVERLLGERAPRADRGPAPAPVAGDPMAMRHDAIKGAEDASGNRAVLVRPPPAPSPSPARSLAGLAELEEASDRTQGLAVGPVAEALPFRAAGAVLAGDEPTADTLELPSKRAARPVTPFEGAAARGGSAPEGGRDVPRAPAPGAASRPPPMVPPRPARLAVTKPGSALQGALQPPASAPRPAVASRQVARPAPVPVAVAASARPAVATDSLAPAPAGSLTPAPAAAALDSPWEPLPLVDYARLSALLAVKGANRAVVLREHQLTEVTFGRLDKHWVRAIGEQTERGVRDLLVAFDLAYVAEQEKHRGAIGVAEYARILVGVERGEVGRVLGALELHLSDLMRLQRVWTKKVADAPKLSEELGRAVEAARKEQPGKA